MNPVTPARPVPGAFFNTPAPAPDTGVRRRLFTDTRPPSSGASSGALVTTGNAAAANPLSNTQLLPPATSEDYSSVTRAARVINRTLQLDESFPDLDSYCRPGASSDYDVQHPDAAWAPFHKSQMYPIPDRIFDHLNQGEVLTKLGLFPAIGYAWASIDSDLFLWDYSHPAPEVIGFEDATHTITAVALVAPKPGVFVKEINHLLVVATTSDIILLGLSATPTATGAKTVTLYQTRMSVSRGGSDVSYIAGSASGRIFFGGSTDTDIYELFYQQEERWFSSRCGKINHTHPGWSSVVPSLPIAGLIGQRQPEYLTGLVIDDTRNLLYSLSNKSTIRTYHLEAPEKLTKVIEKDKTSCLRDFAHMVDRSPLLTDQTSIVSLSPISGTEASKLHLMALTNTGCRLFLSATSSASYTAYGGSATLPPQSMQLQFVKFPPSDAPRGPGNEAVLDKASAALNPSNMGLRFAPGYFFDIVRKSSNSDSLFVSAPDTGKIKRTTPTSALKYFEQGTWIDLGHGSVALEIGLTSAPFSAARQPLGFGNELAVQFDHTPSEFAVLTNTGVHIIRRRRLVDIFAAALRTCIGIGDEGLEREMRRFINQYGRVEACSAALAVVCGQGSDLRIPNGRTLDKSLETLARTAFVEYGGQARVAESDGRQAVADSVHLSSRHDALALYLTRLVRMLWKSKVITTKPGNGNGGVLVSSTVPTAKLAMVQESVDRLQNFLEANKGTIQGLSGPPSRFSDGKEEIAAQKEHQAFHGLRELMKSVAEGISFVLMLFDERVSDIFARLEPAAQQQLKDLTYENLFSQDPGKELAKVLVKAIVNRNIASGANIETVADALRRRCGSFCSPDDVIIFKAQEQLQRASEQVNNPTTLRTLLGESLSLFEKVAGSLTQANLQGAIEQYIQLRYYAGAIQLCLVVARERDRGNTALTWVNDGKPANDPRVRAFEKRQECYGLIHTVLDQLETAYAGEPDTVDGQPTLAAKKREEAYKVVNNSDDEVFHFDLYEWYIARNWTDRILSIQSPHVVTYLQRLAETNYQHAELLCRFYTHRNMYFQAAQVQATLAKSDLDISIKDRITLLSRAKGNASVHTLGVDRQQQQLLNHEVTELLEIAHIQDDLFERLKADSRIAKERLPDIEEALDGPIKGVTELYNDYADQAGYFDLCLLIYHAADYQNPRVIAETWEQLISQVHFDTEEKLAVWNAIQAGEQVPPGVTAPTGEPPLPYESVALQIQTIAHRTSLDSLVFPVDKLFPTVCAYAVENGQDASIGADPCWPVLLFLNLQVPHQLITQVLENILNSQEVPFVGRRRKAVAQWVACVVDAWVREVERRGVISKGRDSAIGVWVSELLTQSEQVVSHIAQSNGGRTAAHELQELQDLRSALLSLKRSVDALNAGPTSFQGSLSGLGSFSFRGGGAGGLV
ncbi:Non-repetitive/WGA-negative nucleoporin C-terminal-domain-containing protein [Cladorrhinum sp. PSN259]|nr:Non-repetitive/WGA-negative nucleoporin C-terminal-domain-containing protein [Cladorrhinum sp. PSN259]